VTLPDLLQSNIPSAQALCASSNGDYGNCALGVSTVLLTTLIAVMRSFVQSLSLDGLPIIHALLMASLYVTLYYGFDYLSRETSYPPVIERFSQISLSLSRVKPSTRSNIIFFVILALGTYLSLTAIIAIPTLQEPADNITSAKQIDDLRGDLSKLMRPDEQFDKEFPSNIATQFEITNTKIYKDTIETKPDNSNNRSVNFAIGELEKDQLTHLSDLRKLWTTLITNYKAAQKDQVQIAAETFEIDNKDRRGVRERNQQYLSIDIWYRRLQTEMFERLNTCRAAIERYGSLSSSLADIVQILSATGTLPESGNGGLLSNLWTQKYRDINDALSQAYKSCTVSVPDDPVPAREEFGRYLGVFGFTAEWLLKTESLALVMITGLLGFGLLGAACSSFIRNVGSRSPGDPLVPNLAGVVIRGGSAAILVFLAVYGGLAVFAGSAANPNPYVVLFTCLAAAVFSEDAWAWGADAFRRNLRDGRRGERDIGRAQ
jgi:hypothetical protein